MRSFKYQPLPNSYQSSQSSESSQPQRNESVQPLLDGVDLGTLPLNHDPIPLAVLEYKGVPDILILKGEYIKYTKTMWSLLRYLFCCCCCQCPCPKKKIIQARTGYLVRIPVTIPSSSTYLSRNRDYTLSYKTWMITNRPNLIGKQGRFFYLGYIVSLDEYGDDDLIIQKGKKIIEEMLEIF